MVLYTSWKTCAHDHVTEGYMLSKVRLEIWMMYWEFVNYYVTSNTLFLCKISFNVIQGEINILKQEKIIKVFSNMLQELNVTK